MASLLALVSPVLRPHPARLSRRALHAAAPCRGRCLAWLNAYVLYLALPALFFTLISLRRSRNSRGSISSRSIWRLPTLSSFCLSSLPAGARNGIANRRFRPWPAAMEISAIWDRVLRCWRLARRRRAGCPHLLLRECRPFHRRSGDDGARRRRDRSPASAGRPVAGASCCFPSSWRPDRRRAAVLHLQPPPLSTG